METGILMAATYLTAITKLKVVLIAIGAAIGAV